MNEMSLLLFLVGEGGLFSSVELLYYPEYAQMKTKLPLKVRSTPLYLDSLTQLFV